MAMENFIWLFYVHFAHFLFTPGLQSVEKETYNLTEEELCELKGGIF